jgi:signal peptidase
MKFVFKLIYYLFIGGVLVIAALLAFSFVPIPGNYKVLVVQSGSMEPAIKTGGIVVSKPQESYQVGDVISYLDRESKKNITHRIYSVEESAGGVSSYITKGDANNAPDPQAITNDRIVGKVIFTLPYVGYAVDTVKKPYGFLAIIIIPAAIIILDELRKIFLEIIKLRKNKQNISAEQNAEN